MADAARRSSGNTVLYVGTLAAEVGLFGTQADPRAVTKFDTAGPNGRPLRMEKRAGEAPVAADERVAETVPVTSDPLATTAERARGIAETAERLSAAGAASVPGAVRNVLVEEGTDEVVEPENVRRGIRLEDGRFIDLTDQLEAIDTRTKLDRMDIVGCIDSTLVRRERVLGAYYIGAQANEAAPVLRLLYEALRARREVAVVKYTVRSRQQLGVIIASGETRTLILLQLVFAEDWREAPAKATAIQEVGVYQRHVDSMRMLLGALHARSDIFDELRDDAIAMREELMAEAREGRAAEVVEPLPAKPDAGDVEEQLEAALAAVQSGQL